MTHMKSFSLGGIHDEEQQYDKVISRIHSVLIPRQGILEIVHERKDAWEGPYTAPGIVNTIYARLGDNAVIYYNSKKVWHGGDRAPPETFNFGLFSLDIIAPRAKRTASCIARLTGLPVESTSEKNWKWTLFNYGTQVDFLKLLYTKEEYMYILGLFLTGRQDFDIDDPERPEGVDCVAGPMGEETIRNIELIVQGKA